MNVIEILLVLLSISLKIDADCPKIYKMIDENHSFCLPKRSIESFVPTAEQIELILELHNKERSLVESVDMQKMYWNADVAKVAQRYAEHCHFDHDTSYQRQPPRIPVFTGQNLAMGYNDWKTAITAWANEKVDFTYGQSAPPGKVIGHYTQMVKSTAVLVGCGLAICPKETNANQVSDWEHFVCNYVTGQTDVPKPYQLPDGSNSGKKGLIDCQGRVCLYDGSLDLKTCRCQCSPYASGQSCEEFDCSAAPDDCGFTVQGDMCKKYANIPDKCPKQCGMCERFEAIKQNYDSVSFDSSGTRSTLFSLLLISYSTLILCRTLFVKE